MRFAFSPRFITLTRGRKGIRLAARAPDRPVIVPRKPACHERAQRVEWRRRELHPRPQFRKSFCQVIVASTAHRPVCILPAPIWPFASLSRTGIC
jgi:hypothetical protein